MGLSALAWVAWLGKGGEPLTGPTVEPVVQPTGADALEPVTPPAAPAAALTVATSAAPAVDGRGTAATPVREVPPQGAVPRGSDRPARGAVAAKGPAPGGQPPVRAPAPSPSVAATEAASVVPLNVVSVVEKGMAAAAAGRNGEAVGHFAACTRDAPGYADCHRLLGAACAREGRTAEAQRAFRRYLELAPGAPDAARVGALLEAYDAAR